MLRAIAAAKKKNDRIDAGKIHDALRRIHLRIPRGEPRSLSFAVITTWRQVFRTAASCR
jgi:hypothetical protein